jgi:hypothetical protein
MNQAFLDYYRCPARYADFRPLESAKHEPQSEYFRLGHDLDSYGALTELTCSPGLSGSLPDLLSRIRIEASTCFLPFDLTKVVESIREERYLAKSQRPLWKKMVHAAYYSCRPCLPVPIRRRLQRAWLKGWERKPFPSWPVDCTVDKILEKALAFAIKTSRESRIPFIWFWPEGKSCCAIMTHDVETAAGLDFCDTLMDINDSFGIKSSFQLIPEARYTVASPILGHMRRRGFEVNIHDLRHDGHLFRERNRFQEQAERINDYARKFGSKGFRSGALYRNLQWYGALTMSYDMSVPNVGHLDPQPGGCCTVMPFYVGNILELPVTTIQDYSLYNILNTYSLDLWRQQIEIISNQHGLISFIVHPDYLGNSLARHTYEELLRTLVRQRAEENVWIPRPGDVDTWWRQRSRLQLVPDGSNWRLAGVGAERAKVAYASLNGNSVMYSFN